jgi:hypothetical protein
MQAEFDFQPGLTRQFPEFIDLMAAVVYGSRAGLSGVAGECDLSPSQLSRMLNRNPDDLRHLPAYLVPKIIHATGDKRPVYWLMESFLEDPDAKRKRAIDDLERLIPTIQSLIESARR